MISGIVCILLFFTIFVYSYFVEPSRLVTGYETISLKNWNKNLNGFKVAVVSDLHIGRKYTKLKRLNEIINKVNSEKPDMIVILGDFDALYIEVSKIPHKDISKTLNKLKAPYGVYAVLGNHDYEPAGVVRNILDNTDIKLLKNTSDYITYKGEKIRICGIDDWWHENTDIEKLIGNTKIPTIFLSHNPDAFDEVPEGVPLTLSGHTHGGEVVFPFYGSPFVPSVHGRAYSKGLIKSKNKQLFITSGVGTISGFRALDPPEIVILSLKKYTGKNNFKISLQNIAMLKTFI